MNDGNRKRNGERGQPPLGMRWLHLPALSAGLVLSACGGGGNVNVEEIRDIPPPPTTAAADFTNDPEYCASSAGRCLNWGLGAVKAAEAYARLARTAGGAAPGTGVTVGLIDTGIDTLHWEFDRRRVTERILIGTGDSSGSSTSHGTAVASLIGARRDGGNVPAGLEGRDFHGIAWGADVKMYAIRLGSRDRDRPYSPLTVSVLATSGATLNGRLRIALADSQGVDILNMSFAAQGLIENYTETQLRTALGTTVIPTLAQGGRADAEKTLLVWAASNDHGQRCTAGTDNCAGLVIDATSPAVYNALQVHIAELRGHAVSVVATTRDGSIASFSNRCGVAARWCIAAPGVDMLTAYYGPDPSTGESGRRGYATGSSGTSFAAPMVAGGLAILKQYYRGQLGNTEVLDRLYATADVTPDAVAPGAQCPAHLDLDGDRTDCELSSTYGRGLMNLDAATRPVGTTSLALGDTLSGKRVAAGASWLRSAGPAGDALQTAFRGREVAMFDDLDAPFWTDLDRFAHTAGTSDLEDRLARFMRPEPQREDRGGYGTVRVPGVPGGLVEAPFAGTRMQAGMNRADANMGWWAHGHASLVPVDRGGLSMSLDKGRFQASALAAAPALHDGQGAAPEPTAGILMGWQPQSIPAGLRFGALREFESALGTTAGGAFGRLASGMVFAGAGFSRDLGGWTIEAQAELGVSGPEASGGIVREVSGVTTSAFEIAVQRTLGKGRRLRLSVAQPLRVESGRMRLDVPVGRTKHGRVVRQTVTAPLTPSGRQIDFAAHWRLPTGKAGGEWRLGATLSVDPGHRAGGAADLALLGGYRLSF